jgi:uridine monophosphate synthetase
VSVPPITQTPTKLRRLPFGERAGLSRKQSNLLVAADVNTTLELLALADVVGPDICVLKTYVDWFGASAPAGTMYKEFGLTVDNVVAKAKDVIREEREFLAPEVAVPIKEFAAEAA